MDMLNGKTVLVTGSSDGIGRQTALELAQRGARIFVHARGEARGQAALDALRDELPNGAFDLVIGDLASLEQVRGLAASVASRTDRLDVLINNAGVKPTTRQVSADGYELTFAVNHLAHFLLTDLLLPLIQKAEGGRILTVSSVSHYRGTIAFDDPQLTHGWDSYKAYAQSKLANVLFAYDLAHRLADTDITSNTLHPGVVSTKLLVEGFGSQGGDSLADGAATSVFLAASPDVAAVSGRYFQYKQVTESAPISHDRAWQERLWTMSAALTGVKG
ncbi:MAG: SDR family oxidoreductase [Chloroflexota bacterium]|nr:SDR family oxidoreductase [Chloroflexota bacterium]